MTADETAGVRAGGAAATAGGALRTTAAGAATGTAGVRTAATVRAEAPAAGEASPIPAASMRADVEELAGRIGPRGTGTSAERAAGDHVAARLAALGLPAARTSVRAVSDQNAFPLASVALTLLAVAAYPFGRAGRLAAAGLALPSAPLLWRAIRLSRSPLGPLLPHVTSGNVVAAVASSGAPVRRVVLLAHLDTNRSRLAWRAGMAWRLERLTWLTLAMLAAPGALYAAGAAAGLARTARKSRCGVLWYASLAPAAYAVGMLVTLLRDWRAPYSPGAHDNAASVAVALEVARRLAARPLERTEVVLAFTGAEETDHAGLVALLAQEPAAMRAADFIGLEGLGSGRLAYLTREGLCDHVRPDPALLAAAERAAREAPRAGRGAGRAAAGGRGDRPATTRLSSTVPGRVRPSGRFAPALAPPGRHTRHRQRGVHGARGGLRERGARGDRRRRAAARGPRCHPRP